MHQTSNATRLAVSQMLCVVGRSTELSSILQHRLAVVPLLHLRPLHEITRYSHDVGVLAVEGDVLLPYLESTFYYVEHGVGVALGSAVEREYIGASCRDELMETR